MKALYTLLLFFCVVSLSACAKQVTYNEALTGDAPIGDTIAAREAETRRLESQGRPAPLCKGIIINEDRSSALVELSGPASIGFHVEPNSPLVVNIPAGRYNVKIWVKNKLILNTQSTAGREVFTYKGEEFLWRAVIFKQ